MLLALSSAPSGVAAAALPSITAARVNPSDAGIRLVLEFTERVPFSISFLANPHRVVIDLAQVRWRLPSRELHIGNALLSSLRYGLFQPGTSRVVLDCTGPTVVNRADFLTSEGSSGYQLVIGLSTATQPPQATIPLPTAELRTVEPVRFAFPPPLRRPQPYSRQRTVVIDPGHGGKDPGARTDSGVAEKHITLEAARLVQRHLAERYGHRVLLTRNRDRSIRLRDRIEFARKHGAELFISIHADANGSSVVRGASIYTLSEQASDAEAAALAERENKADLIVGVDLSHEPPDVANILIDLAQRETMNQSAQVASLLVSALGRETALVRNTHRFAGFAVLKSPDVPSVLLELGHLSNPEDARLLQREDYLNKLAAAIAKAVDTYFSGIEHAARQ
jgi:N-acetylmuramoyl-L-alanine amidase